MREGKSWNIWSRGVRGEKSWNIWNRGDYHKREMEYSVVLTGGQHVVERAVCAHGDRQNQL